MITVCARAKSDWMSSMVCWPACGVRLVAMLWLNAEICAAELLPVGEAVKAANTAIDCSCERIADSLAWAPYCTVIAESIRAVADERAEPGPELPVYHCTVLADPAGHARLAARIASRGSLLSPFAPGIPAWRHHFPLRDRLLCILDGALFRFLL